MFVGLVDAGEPTLLFREDLFICASTLEEAKSLCQDNGDHKWIIYELIPGHFGYQQRWEYAYYAFGAQHGDFYIDGPHYVWENF